MHGIFVTSIPTVAPYESEMPKIIMQKIGQMKNFYKIKAKKNFRKLAPYNVYLISVLLWAL